MKLFIGVDLGTTGIRAGVYGENFDELGSGYGRSIIKKGDKGEIIQETEDLYRETLKAVKEAVERANIDPKNIACLSLCGQMAGILGIDEKWNAVTPYDSWLDTRCANQVETIKERAYSLVIEKTGNIPSFNHGPKILWWKENERETFKRIRNFIQPAAYVAGRLCNLKGEDAFTDWTFLHFSGFSDSKRLRWDADLAGFFDIPLDKLPKITSPFTIIGETEGQDLANYHLPEGIPLAAGCGDTASSLLGTGAVDEGIAVNVTGSASVFSLTTKSFITDMEGKIYTARSALQDTWYSMSYINGGGLNLEWFRDSFAPGQSFKTLDDSVQALPPGSEGLLFLPHLEGRAYPNNPQIRGEWKGFTRAHGVAHFYRSILEGIGYEFALLKERILGLLKSRRSYDVRVVGGGAKSGVWNQIKADILNSNYQTINREDISTLGQAIIAACAAGSVKDIRRTINSIVTIEEVFKPNRKNHEIYREHVEKYEELLNNY